VPTETPDRDLFSLLSDFYLNPPTDAPKQDIEEMDLMMV
jgi:light-independent protochlorophyllide reductase subunit L